MFELQQKNCKEVVVPQQQMQVGMEGKEGKEGNENDLQQSQVKHFLFVFDCFGFAALTCCIGFSTSKATATAVDWSISCKYAICDKIDIQTRVYFEEGVYYLRSSLN